MDNYKLEKSKLDEKIRKICKRTGWTKSSLTYYLKQYDKLLIQKENRKEEWEYFKCSCDIYELFLCEIKNEVNSIILSRFNTDIEFSSSSKLKEFNLAESIRNKYPNNKYNMLSKINEDYRNKMKMIERFKKVFRNINKSLEIQREYYRRLRKNGNIN